MTNLEHLSRGDVFVVLSEPYTRYLVVMEEKDREGGFVPVVNLRDGSFEALEGRLAVALLDTYEFDKALSRLAAAAA